MVGVAGRHVKATAGPDAKLNRWLDGDLLTAPRHLYDGRTLPSGAWPMTAPSRNRGPMLATVLALLGCVGVISARGQDTTPRGYAVQPFTPPGFKLPDGNGCAGEIARWQAVQGNDYAGGNVSLKVYNQIQNEIDRAATLCESGQDAQARKMVSDSRRRHGYPQ